MKIKNKLYFALFLSITATHIFLHSIKANTKLSQPIHHMIIIGSGPAGLTAGIYAAWAGLNPIIIEGENPNGQLINAVKVKNWPGIEEISGFEITSNLRDHALKVGAQFLPESVTKVDFTKKPFILSCINSLGPDLQLKATMGVPNEIDFTKIFGNPS